MNQWGPPLELKTPSADKDEGKDELDCGDTSGSVAASPGDTLPGEMFTLNNIKEEPALETIIVKQTSNDSTNQYHDVSETEQTVAGAIPIEKIMSVTEEGSSVAMVRDMLGVIKAGTSVSSMSSKHWQLQLH